MIALGSAAAACSYYLGYLGAVKSKASLRENQASQIIRLSEERNALIKTMEKINEERVLIENQVEEFFNQRDTWNVTKPHTHRMFKPGYGLTILELNEELHKLHKVLMETLLTYPSYEPEFANEPQALRSFGTALEEHHTLACQNAAYFFKEFNDYLQNLDKATIEVQPLPNL